MAAAQAYVISISAGTGCYRHICISKDATLLDLHSAILDAFGFEDDHAHAFFMDNQMWSRTDSYYAGGIEDESRHTCDYTLDSMAMREGKPFKYVFDFGDEWVFQCKVLRTLDEPCAAPSVVRSQGDAPEQYPQQDEFGGENDAGEAEFPGIFSPAKLKKLYAKLNMPEEITASLHTYFDAMAQFYGVIPLRKALEIINAQNDEPISEKDFTAFAEIVRHEEHFYRILGENEIYSDGKSPDPLDRELVEESLYEVDLNDYDEMIDAQKGKPYYIPRKEELLKYADDCYFEQTLQSRALRTYFRRQKGLTRAQAEEFVEELQLFASSGENDFEEVMDDIIRMGMRFENELDVNEFLRLYADMSNHTRMAMNRGHTPEELSKKLSPQDRSPKSIVFGPHITAALKNGTMDMEELRRGILQMEIPNEGLRRSMLENLDHIQNPAVPAPKSVEKKKIGRNDPCPCGSGKKYKNCCGRNQ